MKGKLNIKIIVIIVVIIAIIGIVLFGIFTKNEDSANSNVIASESLLTGNKYVEEVSQGLKVNTSEQMKEVKRLGNVEIKINQLTSLNNLTTILGVIKNTGNEPSSENDLNLLAYDDKGNVLARQNVGNVIPALDSQQELELNISIIGDWANAYDLKFEK